MPVIPALEKLTQEGRGPRSGWEHGKLGPNLGRQLVSVSSVPKAPTCQTQYCKWQIYQHPPRVAVSPGSILFPSKLRDILMRYDYSHYTGEKDEVLGNWLGS